MGILVNLKQIISNKNKLIDLHILKNLLESAKSEGILRSSIHYNFATDYVSIEYISKSIPSYTFEIPRLFGEQVLTIRSYDDSGIPDSFLIHHSESNYHYESAQVMYEFDKIIINGERDSLRSFLQETFNKSDDSLIFQTPENNSFYSFTGNGVIYLNSFNDIEFPYGMTVYENRHLFIHNDQLIESDSTPVALACGNRKLSEHFLKYLFGLINSQFKEYLGIHSVKIMKANTCLLEIQYDEKENEWKHYRSQSLLNLISNREIILAFQNITA
ncbi:hypothetical protein D3C87_85620 [compost metagenome]